MTYPLQQTEQQVFPCPQCNAPIRAGQFMCGNCRLPLDGASLARFTAAGPLQAPQYAPPPQTYAQP